MSNVDVELQVDGAVRARRWRMRLAVLVVVAFLAFQFIQLHKLNAPKQIDKNNLALVSLDGTPIAPATTSGKAIVLNYWAPWCPPCRLEIPWLQHLQELHPNDLLVVGVVADPDQYQRAQPFMRSRGVSYTQARETPTLDNAIGLVSSLPTTF